MPTPSMPLKTNSLDPIDFANYERISQDMLSILDVLGGRMHRLDLRHAFPEGPGLEAAWADLESAALSLTSFLDISDESFHAPRREGAGPFDLSEWPLDVDRLADQFPPTVRPEMEDKVLRLAGLLPAYRDFLAAKFHDRLFITDFGERAIDADLRPLHLLGWIRVDHANLERFRNVFREDDNYGFGEEVDLEDAYAQVESILTGMSADDRVTANPRSRLMPLLRRYLSHASRHRSEIMRDFDYLVDENLADLRRLNTRWSFQGEPAYG